MAQKGDIKLEAWRGENKVGDQEGEVRRWRGTLDNKMLVRKPNGSTAGAADKLSFQLSKCQLHGEQAAGT